ncbi:hypothetical protein ACQEU8_11610 [Streptomyces sp. CA-250714]|uniref:hypothetical protein n=1 Tax=Streptomyces sp. CA-250714 TaxID=3240060 RepID=UPI003D8B5034
MLRLTLDTNCVVDAVMNQGYASEVNQLVELARANRVGLWLTSGFQADQSISKKHNYQANLQWLSERPLIGQIPGPFRLDFSPLGGNDELTHGETLRIDEAIKTILRPSYRPGDAFPERKINDVHHLTAHWMAGHDAFVTRDSDDMVRKREKLRECVGIDVITPPEAVARVWES